jgi:hypothetical protein
VAVSIIGARVELGVLEAEKQLRELAEQGFVELRDTEDLEGFGLEPSDETAWSITREGLWFFHDGT